MKIPILSQVVKGVQMVFSDSSIHIFGKSESPLSISISKCTLTTTIFYLKNCEAVVISSFFIRVHV